MRQWDDAALLSAYANRQSEAAFGVLVERYVALVYSAALRQLQNPHLAQEATQAVFLILAQKARRLNGRTALSGWLCRTAHFVARNALKAELRRQYREQEAHMQSLLNEPDADAWTQFAPLLDEAVAQLGEGDRNAIVLRFYERKPLNEVGNVLGIDPDAAQKRVARAVEKLRKFFTRRGVALSAAAITGVLAANSVQAAPAGLAATVTAVAAKGTVASTSTLTLIKGALKLMAWTKIKTAVVAGAIVLFAAGTTTITVKEIQAHRTYPWQVQNANSEVLRHVPPQVRIVRAKYPDSMGGGVVWVNDGNSSDNSQVLGIAQPVPDIISSAYDQSSVRCIFPDQISPGKYDFIANLRSGNPLALQAEIRKEFGLVGRRETRETDVFFLQVQNRRSSGLKSSDPRNLEPHSASSWRSGAGHFTSKNQDLSHLAWFLEAHFKLPVVDQTILAGRYDIDLNWAESDYRHPNLDALKAALTDQLGLELVPGRAPIEMLVVEKAAH